MSDQKLTLVSNSAHPVLSPDPTPPPRPLFPHSAALLPLHRLPFEAAFCDAHTQVQRRRTTKELIETFEVMPLGRGISAAWLCECDWETHGLPFYDAEVEIVLSRPVKDSAEAVLDDVAIFVELHEVLMLAQQGMPLTVAPVQDLRPEESHSPISDFFVLWTLTEGFTLAFFAKLHHPTENSAVTALVRMTMDTPRGVVGPRDKINWSSNFDDASGRLMGWIPDSLRAGISKKMAFIAKHTHQYTSTWTVDGSRVKTIRPYVVIAFRESTLVHDIVDLFFPKGDDHEQQG